MSSKLVRIFWRIFFYGLGAFILFLVLINLGVFGSLPSLKELENPSITLATEVFAEDGTPMGKYYKDKGNRSNEKSQRRLGRNSPLTTAIRLHRGYNEEITGGYRTTGGKDQVPELGLFLQPRTNPFRPHRHG